MNYQQQAMDFLEKTKTKFEISFSHTGLCDFSGTERKHHIFNVILSNKQHTYTLKFTDSLHGTERRDYANSINSLYVGEDSYPKKLGFTIKNQKLIKEEILNARKPPTAYDVLACVTKYPPVSFSTFCSEYGYDTDSRKALKIWEEDMLEYENINRLFSGFMTDLKELS